MTEQAPASGPELLIDSLKAELEPLMDAAVQSGKEEEVDRVINRWEEALRGEDDRLRKATEDTFEYLDEAKKEYAADSPEVREAEEKFNISMNERKQLKAFWEQMDAYYEGALSKIKKEIQTPEMKIKALGVQFESAFAAATDDDARRAVCDKYESLLNAIAV